MMSKATKIVLFVFVVNMASASFHLKPTKREEDVLDCDLRSTMPTVKIWKKNYYFGTFFKANWFKAFQFCRYHGMHLAAISSQEENENLLKYIYDLGYGSQSFWLSGTDGGSEGKFYWMSTGVAVSFSDWLPGNPDNDLHPSGEREDCLHYWNPNGKGLRWNDARCSLEFYFICENQ